MSPPSQTITFIIVNYNGAEDTVKCIDSITKQDCNNAKINLIIVDNASASDDIDAIKQHCQDLSWVEFINSCENIGYFPAFNLAIDKHYQEIIDTNTTIVLCNNDLIFDQSFISIYLTKTYTPETLVISPNVITLDGRYQNPHVLNKFSIFRKLMLRLYFTNYLIGILLSSASKKLKARSKNTKMNAPPSQFIYAGIGACYILPPVFFKKFNRLEDRIFLGGEELILAAEVIAREGKNFYDKDLIVIHAEGVSFSKKTSRWRYEQSKKSYTVYKDLL